MMPGGLVYGKRSPKRKLRFLGERICYIPVEGSVVLFYVVSDCVNKIGVWDCVG
jgi:hypothetical protein